MGLSSGLLIVDAEYGDIGMVDQGFHLTAGQHTFQRVAVVVGDADQVGAYFIGEGPNTTLDAEVPVDVGFAWEWRAHGPEFLHRFLAQDVRGVEQGGGMDLNQVELYSVHSGSYGGTDGKIDKSAIPAMGKWQQRWNASSVRLLLETAERWQHQDSCFEGRSYRRRMEEDSRTAAGRTAWNLKG